MKTWFRLIVVVLLMLSSAPALAQEVLTVNKIDTPSTTDLTLGPTADLLLNPTGNDVLPTTGYDINLGMLTRKFLTLHAAELWVETLVAQNTIATIGGRVLVAPTTLLTADLASGATSIQVKHNNLANGDRVYMEADGSVEFMAITSSASGSAGAYIYSVTRNLDGSGANNWTAGDAVLNTGQTGNGFIDLYSVRGVKAGTEIGPTIVGNVRTSSTYNAWEPRWAIGNLDGLYGYGPAYGAAFGVPGGARVLVDATNGIRIFGGDNDEKVTIDTSGNATFDGRVTIGSGRNMIRNADCTIATTDWNLFTNATGTGTVTAVTLNGPWPIVSGAFGLGNVDNDCFIAVAGTPTAGTVSSMYGGGRSGGTAGAASAFPVAVGLIYEGSAYVAVHRSGNTAAALQWLQSDGTTVISTTFGNNCTSASAGGVTLAGYCRTGVIATAPSGAVYGRLVVQTTHTAELDPFIFIVHTYFGEARTAQEDLSEWGPGGVTTINNGLIETDAINARTIAAGTITASEIAAGTITADRLSVSTLSAIAADLGTVTAGTISGVTATFGGTVTLDGSGLTISSGTGSGNKIKWSGGGPTIHGLTDNSMWIAAADLFVTSGGGGQFAFSGSILRANNAFEATGNVRLVGLAGSGSTSFVCTDNDGDLYASSTRCDGLPEPAVADPAALLERVEYLERELATLRAVTGVRQ